MNNTYITLELSGSPMTGFRHMVKRALFYNATKDDIIRRFHRAMIEFCREYNMWQLEQNIKGINLHIHDDSYGNKNTIYICTDPHLEIQK